MVSAGFLWTGPVSCETSLGTPPCPARVTVTAGAEEERWAWPRPAAKQHLPSLWDRNYQPLGITLDLPKR